MEACATVVDHADYTAPSRQYMSYSRSYLVRIRDLSIYLSICPQISSSSTGNDLWMICLSPRCEWFHVGDRHKHGVVGDRPTYVRAMFKGLRSCGRRSHSPPATLARGGKVEQKVVRWISGQRSMMIAGGNWRHVNCLNPRRRASGKELGHHVHEYAYTDQNS